MLGRRHQGLLLILSKRHTSLQVKTHAGIYEHYEYVRPYEQTQLLNSIVINRTQVGVTSVSQCSANQSNCKILEHQLPKQNVVFC